MRRAALPLAIASVLLALPPAAAAPPADAAPAADDRPLLTLRVSAADGGAVEGAEAFLIDPTHGLPLSDRWKPVKEGRVSFATDEIGDPATGEPPPATVRCVVRAPGYAWAMAMAPAAPGAARDLTLERGTPVTLAITDAGDRAIPADLVPIVFVEGQSVAAWLSGVQRRRDHEPADGVFSAVPPVPAVEGRVELRVPASCEALYVLVNHPGFLRAYQAGPFDREQIASGTIDVELPRRGALTVNVTPKGDAPPAYEDCGVVLSCSPEIPDGGWSFSLPPVYEPDVECKVVYYDLPPGPWGAEAFTGTKETRRDTSRPDFATESGWVKLEPGEPATIDLALETWDEDAMRERLAGDYDLTMVITSSDGTPAAGRAYALKYSLRKFRRQIDAAAGTIPDDGRVLAKGLAAGEVAPLYLEIDGQYAGSIYLRGEETEQTQEFRLAPAAGETAPDITLYPLDDSAPITLSSLRGQVVFLDFWASWCGPCQEPMAHADELVAHNRERWAGRAVLIGASIDGERATIEDHVAKKGWTNVLQTWCGEGAWKSEPAHRYGVTGVPSSFLIDRDGVIAWAGHPADADVEKRIDALLDD